MCVLFLSSGRTQCPGQTAGLLHNFLYTPNSNCSATSNSTVLIYGELKTVLVTANSTCFLLRRTQCSTQLCSKTAQLRQRVLSYLSTYFLKSPVSGPFIKAYSVKSCYFVLCQLCITLKYCCEYYYTCDYAPPKGSNTLIFLGQQATYSVHIRA